jgi:hypothetical protein
MTTTDLAYLSGCQTLPPTDLPSARGWEQDCYSGDRAWQPSRLHPFNESTVRLFARFEIELLTQIQYTTRLAVPPRFPDKPVT